MKILKYLVLPLICLASAFAQKQVTLNNQSNVLMPSVPWISFPATALRLLDTNASHALILSNGSDLTSNRTLTLIPGDSDLTVDFSSGTRGDLFYRNATKWVRLAPGTAGYMLTTNGVNSEPTWVAPATSGPLPSQTFNNGNVLVTNGSNASWSTGIATLQKMGAAASRMSDATVNVIVDSDIGEDVDDVGGFAVLHQLMTLGECNILAMGYVGTHSFGAPAINALNTFYGRSDIPVGTGTSAYTGTDYYGTLLASFPNRLGSATPPSALNVYRKALAGAPDGTVTIIFFGELSNLYRLYNSPADSISPLTGEQLVLAKCAKIVILGGGYPSYGREHDFAVDPAASQVINQLSASLLVIWSGIENGILSETNSTQPTWSPLRASYDAFFAIEGGTKRASWAAHCVLYAVRGLSFGADTYFNISAQGTNVIALDAQSNVFTVGAGKNQYYITPALDPTTFSSRIQALQDSYPIESRPSGVINSSGYRINEPVVIGGPGPHSLTQYNQVGTYRGTIGIDNGSTIATGASAGEMVIRYETGTLRFSSNGVLVAGLDTAGNFSANGTGSHVFGTTNTVTLSAAGAEVFGTVNGSGVLSTRNTAVHAEAFSRFKMGNDSSATLLDAYAFSSAYTPGVWEKQNGVAILANGAGGLSIGSSNASASTRIFGGGVGGIAINIDGTTATIDRGFAGTPQALSGAGAINLTTLTTALTTSGGAQALTLANGANGQIKTIVHDVDGGSAVLTPTTKTGFSTITFTNAGDTVTLQYLTTRGWFVISSYGAVVAP